MAGLDASALQGLPRRERRRLEMRRRILDAAAELFADRGYHATTVVDLAERADVAKKTLFHHFPSKEHVLRALARQVFERLLSDVAAVGKADLSTRERITAFFARVDRLAERTGPMAREMTLALLHATDEAGLHRDEASRFRGALEGILQEGVTRGEVTRRHAPETLAESIAAVYFSLIVNWAQNEAFPVTRKAREAAAFLADAIEPRPGEA